MLLPPCSDILDASHPQVNRRYPKNVLAWRQQLNMGNLLSRLSSNFLIRGIIINRLSRYPVVGTILLLLESAGVFIFVRMMNVLQH
jgi:hypothetical protein